MAPNSNEGKVFYDDQDRPYTVINGRSVYMRSTQRNDAPSGSGRSIAPSVTSARESRRFAPQPTDPASWPQRNEPSHQQVRRVGGVDLRTAFGGQGSVESDPPRNASDPQGRDHFREKMQNDRHGPPRDSRFAQTYADGKDQDLNSELRQEEYKNAVKNAPKHPKAELRANRDMYKGNPPATREIHEGLGRLAITGQDAATGAAGARREMAQGFVGYDSQRGARGHDQRVEVLEKRGNNLGKSAAGHFGAFGGDGKAEASTQLAAARQQREANDRALAAEMDRRERAKNDAFERSRQDDRGKRPEVSDRRPPVSYAFDERAAARPARRPSISGGRPAERAPRPESRARGGGDRAQRSPSRDPVRRRRSPSRDPGRRRRD